MSDYSDIRTEHLDPGIKPCSVQYDSGSVRGAMEHLEADSSKMGIKRTPIFSNIQNFNIIAFILMKQSIIV